MAKIKALAAQLHKNNLGNNFFLYSPLYSSSRSMVCEEFQNEYVMNIVIKTLNFLNSSSLNHHEFVALLEEIESEYGEIICPSNVTWLISGSVLKELF